MAGPKDRVEIIDCTLRDGSYVADFQFTARDTESICRGLARAGIRMIEVGHGLGLGASRAGHGKARESDEAYLEAARAGAGRAKVGAFFIPGIGSAEDIAAARRRGLDFIRIGADVTRIESAREHVARARTLGLEVSLNMMKSYAVDLAGMASVAATVREYGASIVTVVDSAGCMLPKTVAEYVRVVGECAGAAVGFHGHDNLGLAHANCLAAAEAGASFIDGSLQGMGRSAGNARTEVLAHLLRAAGHGGDVDSFELFDTAERFVAPRMPKTQGQPALDVVLGMSRFHSSHLPRLGRAADRHAVDLMRLVVAVSEIDCVDPSDELVERVARTLSSGTRSG